MTGVKGHQERMDFIIYISSSQSVHHDALRRHGVTHEEAVKTGKKLKRKKLKNSIFFVTSAVALIKSKYP
jgi:hypothetical protein